MGPQREVVFCVTVPRWKPQPSSPDFRWGNQGSFEYATQREHAAQPSEIRDDPRLNRARGLSPDFCLCFARERYTHLLQSQQECGLWPCL